MKSLKAAITAFIVPILMGVTTAGANVITGDLWHVPDSVAQNAIPANVPGTTPDVVFDVNSPLNFTTAGSTQTFLNSGGAFNIVQNTPGALAAAISPSLIEFLGIVSVTNGQTFTVTHDDGLTLTIGGLSVINVPGPTGPVQTTATYTGPTGNFPFQLVYGECCGGSAVLQVNLPFSNTPGTSLPEPGSLAILGVVLGACGLTARRRNRASH